MGKTPELKLKEGDVAPNFTADINGGGRLSLSDLVGKNVILYFYPKDDTPGCTKEACAFRDAYAQFQQRDAVLLGVSTDSVRSHEKFAGKYKLPFTLLADPGSKIIDTYKLRDPQYPQGDFAYGVPRPIIFILDKNGVIKAKLYEETYTKRPPLAVVLETLDKTAKG